MSISARVTGLLALLALVPVSIYLVESGQADLTSSVLAAFNVVLITAMLFVILGGSSGSDSQVAESGH